MAFIIDNTRIAFIDYRKLLDHEVNHPFVIDVVSLLEEWNDHAVSFLQVKTSGSTGIPKRIELSKEAAQKSAQKTIDHFQLSSGDTALLALPVKYIAGKMMIIRAIVGELDLVLKEPCATPLKGESINISFIPLTPYQFTESYNEDNSSFEKVRTVLLGGGPVGRVEQEIASKISAEVIHGYGMTETITHIATRVLSDPIYTALPGVTFSSDKKNRLIIRADHLDSEIATQDAIDLISDKTFIWKGRADNIINSGGIKISPEQLESRIADYIDDAYFVYGEEDEAYGQKLVLYIESTSPTEYIDIKDRLKIALSKFELPKEVYLLSNFLKTETGKVKRLQSIAEYGKNKITL